MKRGPANGFGPRARRLLGLARSFWLYYGVPGRIGATRRFYRQFVGAGDLCFDIGAHVGNRSHAWLGLGARVVAVEPQPDFARILRLLFRNQKNLEVVEAGIASEPGTITLRLSRRHPTVTTASAGFIDAVASDPSFAAVRWDDEVVVPALTLDQLMGRFGLPAFVKIDVEGFEAEVLDGLSTPIPALSFEYLEATLPSALRCIDRLESLDSYIYNLSLGESLKLASPTWLEAKQMRAWLRFLPAGTASGDIYARRVSPLTSPPSPP